jgi:hypothetical protein
VDSLISTLEAKLLPVGETGISMSLTELTAGTSKYPGETVFRRQSRTAITASCLEPRAPIPLVLFRPTRSSFAISGAMSRSAPGRGILTVALQSSGWVVSVTDETGAVTAVKGSEYQFKGLACNPAVLNVFARVGKPRAHTPLSA